jgi:monoamine oxidase
MPADAEVVIVGGGAAGIAAARRLADSKVKYLLLEARERLGGRAWTRTAEGFPIDLGCGWLHSADRNPWHAIAVAQGATVDQTPPPWTRPVPEPGFPKNEQRAFVAALESFHARLEDYPDSEPDVAAATFLDPACRWNPLIDAISTFVSGAQLAQISARDIARYHDSGVNWRVVEGYGHTIAAHGDGLRVRFNCAVTRIDHGGQRLRVDTPRGAITADAAIVTVPSSLIAGEQIAFTPALPDKVEAASHLALGLADKLFLWLDDAEAFEKDSRLFGRKDSAATASYHLRPFGRPLIEAYFGGSLAAELEAEGERAFADFAVAELSGLLGSAVARRVRPVAHHGWLNDPFARGSYSFARPGKADVRDTLAAPVNNRLFFAGEACSRHDYSTAHGAYRTGRAAADQLIAAVRAVSA